MNKITAYELLRASVQRIAGAYDDVEALEETAQPGACLVSYGLDVAVFGEIVRDLENRLGVPSLEMESLLVPERFNTCTVGDVLDHLVREHQPLLRKEPIVVYVDDEEQNLFIFKRKFGKDFQIKTFSDPVQALEYVKKTPEVALVITDEVMPGLRGNDLCTEIKKIMPGMEFILITGNPENDNNLMYRALRQKRFYDFIQKPVDFDGRRDEYLGMIRRLIRKE